MPICIECGKSVLMGYQTIKTQRKTEINICNKCLKKEKEATNARDSKQSV